MSPGAQPAAPLLEVRVGAARAWCTGRAQGNLGDHVGDDPAVVARHRAAVVSAIAAAAGTGPEWVWIRQVHGADVHVATRARRIAGAESPVADAVVTADPGLVLAVVTADCAPLVVASDDAVGVVHAGHRGLALGIVEAAVAQLRDIGSGEVRAFLGPCIRAARYEFGADDLARFAEQFGDGVVGTTRSGRPALDIPAAVGVALDRAGVTEYVDCDVCTADSPDYFSYRRDGRTGRQATIAVLS